MLEPTERIREAEAAGRLADRLALTEEAKHLPAQAVWNEFCVREQVPAVSIISNRSMSMSAGFCGNGAENMTAITLSDDHRTHLEGLLEMSRLAVSVLTMYRAAAGIHR
jgi:hypothetical protein